MMKTIAMLLLTILLAACTDEPVVATPVPDPVVKTVVQTGRSTCIDHILYFEIARPTDWPVWVTLLKNNKYIPC